MKRNMMATKAFSKTNLDISRDQPDLAHIYGEDGENYYGEWAASMIGFIDVRFPKDTTRDLTPEEREHFGTKVIELNGMARRPALIVEDDTPARKTWDFPRENIGNLMDLRVKDAVSMALGGASTCWVGGTGDLEFDSQALAEVGDKLNAFLNDKRRQDLRRLLLWAEESNYICKVDTTIVWDQIVREYIQEDGEL